MSSSRKAKYCPSCQSRSMFGWCEPRHHLYSALTLAMVGGSFITPATGGLMLGLWLHRISTTTAWGCLHCDAAA